MDLAHGGQQFEHMSTEEAVQIDGYVVAKLLMTSCGVFFLVSWANDAVVRLASTDYQEARDETVEYIKDNDIV